MARIQNVVAAVDGGPIVLLAGFGTVLICFAFTAFLRRWGRAPVPKPDKAAHVHAERVLGGDPE